MFLNLVSSPTPKKHKDALLPPLEINESESINMKPLVLFYEWQT